MADQQGSGAVHHHNLSDILAGSVFLTAPAVWPVWPWFNALWEHFPTPTAFYMVISAAFMLFQMSDKLGLLERFKRRKTQEPPELPEEH